MGVPRNGRQRGVGPAWEGGGQRKAELERQLLGVLPAFGVPGPSSVQEMLAQTSVSLEFYV